MTIAKPEPGKRGKKSKRVRLEDIAEACGIAYVQRTELDPVAPTQL